MPEFPFVCSKRRKGSSKGFGSVPGFQRKHPAVHDCRRLRSSDIARLFESAINSAGAGVALVNAGNEAVHPLQPSASPRFIDSRQKGMKIFDVSLSHR